MINGSEINKINHEYTQKKLKSNYVILKNQFNDKLIKIAYLNADNNLAENDFKIIVNFIIKKENLNITRFVGADTNIREDKICYLGYFEFYDIQLNKCIYNYRNLGKICSYNDIDLLFNTLVKTGIFYQNSFNYFEEFNPLNIYLKLNSELTYEMQYLIENSFSFNQYTNEFSNNFLKIKNLLQKNDFNLFFDNWDKREKIIYDKNNIILTVINDKFKENINRNVYEMAIIILCMSTLTDYNEIYNNTTKLYNDNILNIKINDFYDKYYNYKMGRIILKILKDNDNKKDFISLNKILKNKDLKLDQIYIFNKSEKVNENKMKILNQEKDNMKEAIWNNDQFEKKYSKKYINKSNNDINNNINNNINNYINNDINNDTNNDSYIVNDKEKNKFEKLNNKDDNKIQKEVEKQVKDLKSDININIKIPDELRKLANPDPIFIKIPYCTCQEPFNYQIYYPPVPKIYYVESQKSEKKIKETENIFKKPKYDWQTTNKRDYSIKEHTEEKNNINNYLKENNY